MLSNIATPVTSINSPANKLLIKIYPAPVFQHATIEVAIPETGNVQIDLLNITGQKFKNIHSGFLLRGTYSINFNDNKDLPSGVYIIKVNTKTLSGTLKFVLK